MTSDNTSKVWQCSLCGEWVVPEEHICPREPLRLYPLDVALVKEFMRRRQSYLDSVYAACDTAPGRKFKPSKVPNTLREMVES